MASKQSIEAGKGHVELSTRADPLYRGLAAAERRFQDYGRTIAQIGAGIAASGASLQAPFHYGLSVLAQDAAALASVARSTGLNAENLGQLAYAVGAEVDQLGLAVNHVGRFMQQAAVGAEEATRAMRAMGLTFAELNGLSPDERFLRIADALSQVGDAGQRAALRQAVFGEQAARFNLEGGAAGIQERAARGDALGAGFSADLIAQGQAYNRAMRDLRVATSQAWAYIGSAIADYMTDFIRMVTRIVVAIQHWVAENRPLVLIAFRVAEAVTAAGFAIVALGSAIYGTSYAFRFMSGAIQIVWGGISAIAAVTRFAATGFGILTVAGKLWGATTAVASGIATAAMLAYNAVASATAIITNVLTFGFYGLIGAVIGVGAVLGFGIPAAIIALAGYLTYLGAQWLATTETFQSAAAIIRGVFQGLANGLSAVFGPVISFWSGLFSGFINGSVLPLFSRIGSAASSAMDVTMRAVVPAFARMVSVTTSSIGGIMAAFETGDWGAMWEIFSTYARLAWLELSMAFEQTWIAWKGFAFDTWTAITDFLSDTFDDVVTSLHASFVVLWAEVKAMAFESLAAIADAAAEAAPEPLRDLLRAQAQGLRIDAQRARQQGIREANQIDEDALINRIGLGIERGARDAIAQSQRELDLARAGGDLAEVARLQNRLAELNLDAWINQQQQMFEQLANGLGGGPDGDGGFVGGRSFVAGGFSAGALFGALGATESPLSRMARLAEEERADRQRQLALMQELIRVAGARVG